MRLLNAFAALSGLIALVMLMLAAHAFRESLTPENLERIHLAAFIQLGTAGAGLAIANRTGRLTLIAGAMMLAGAGLFAATLYALALTGLHGFVYLAPVGGITLMLGWALLVFCRPS